MSTLTEECLNSIYTIQESVLNSQIDVYSALINEEIKNVKMQLDQSNKTEVVQEGFWSPRREEGENIFKTIFLFIPRMIVGLINAIKQRWMNLKINSMTPEQREFFRYANMSEKEKIVHMVNHPRFLVGDLPNKEECLLIKSKYVDFDGVIQYYRDTEEVFNTYLELINVSKASKVDEAITMIVHNRSMNENHLRNFHDIYKNELTSHKFDGNDTTMKLGDINEIHAKVMASIKDTMNKVLSWYNNLEKDNSGMFGDKESVASARQFINIIEKEYEKLTENDLKLYDEFKEMREVLYRIMASLSKFSNSK